MMKSSECEEMPQLDNHSQCRMGNALFTVARKDWVRFNEMPGGHDSFSRFCNLLDSWFAGDVTWPQHRTAI